MQYMVEMLNSVIWGIPGVTAILGVGVWLTAKCAWPQIRYFGRAAREFFRDMFGRRDPEGTSSFRALCTALAATVGTGNIAGVAGAISIGGPGAIFWMWVSAFVGMATKFAESTLALHFCQRDGQGNGIGGPMYTIQNGMGKRWKGLAWLYSLFGLLAGFGVGNATQINAVVCAMEETARGLGLEQGSHTGLMVGLILAVPVYKMVSGGAGRIGQLTEILIPFVSGAYIILCLVAIGFHWENLPVAVTEIFLGAFSPKAVTGGVVGSIWICVRTGISRGVFTNEAGMGTGAIAHSAAQTDHPVRQGLMGIMEVFVDTMVICTMTALVILTSGVEIPYGTVTGSELTAQALTASFGPWVSALLCACLCLFALATVLGWGLYSGRCAEYLFGGVNWKLFAGLQAAAVILGAVLETGIVWALADLMNGLMMIPNLISLVALAPTLVCLTEEWDLCYNRRRKKGKIRYSEENYERERNWRDSPAYPPGPQ